MKIGILETGHAPSQIQKTIGDYSEMFRALFSGHNFSFVSYDVENIIVDEQKIPASTYS